MVTNIFHSLFMTAAGFQVSQLTVGGSGSSHSISVISSSSRLSDQQSLVLGVSVTSNFGKFILVHLHMCFVFLSGNCLMSVAFLETVMLAFILSYQHINRSLITPVANKWNEWCLDLRTISCGFSQ